MKTIKKSPVLQSLTRTGKKKFWQIVGFKNGRNEHYYKTIWWQEGSVKQESTPVKVTRKNVGRANETTPKEQLLSEMRSIEKKYRDKGYSEDGSKDHIPVKPMLAHKYRDHSDKVTYPCYVQPKLDGFRMLKSKKGDVSWTRGGKEHVRECIEHLMWETCSIVDGELMLPHMPKLQETARAAKKFRPEVSPTLHYYVYDVVAEDLTFDQRHAVLKAMMKTAPENVVLVETIEVQNEDELWDAHARFVSEGFEGTIIRHGDDGYDIGHRSYSLLKLKDFQDAEFKIVDVLEGEGSFKGKAIFVCVTEGGEEFKATPEGTAEHRAELWEKRDELIGKWLTVKFGYYSESGRPTGNTVGIDIRDEGEF